MLKKMVIGKHTLHEKCLACINWRRNAYIKVVIFVQPLLNMGFDFSSSCCEELKFQWIAQLMFHK